MLHSRTTPHHAVLYLTQVQVLRRARLHSVLGAKTGNYTTPRFAGRKIERLITAGWKHKPTVERGLLQGRAFKCRKKVKTPPTKLLDKTILNPRPEIDLPVASLTVSDESNSGHQN